MLLDLLVWGVKPSDITFLVKGVEYIPKYTTIGNIMGYLIILSPIIAVALGPGLDYIHGRNLPAQRRVW